MYRNQGIINHSTPGVFCSLLEKSLGNQYMKILYFLLRILLWKNLVLHEIFRIPLDFLDFRDPLTNKIN